MTILDLNKSISKLTAQRDREEARLKKQGYYVTTVSDLDIGDRGLKICYGERGLDISFDGALTWRRLVGVLTPAFSGGDGDEFVLYVKGRHPKTYDAATPICLRNSRLA